MAMLSNCQEYSCVIKGVRTLVSGSAVLFGVLFPSVNKAILIKFLLTLMTDP